MRRSRLGRGGFFAFGPGCLRVAAVLVMFETRTVRLDDLWNARAEKWFRGLVYAFSVGIAIFVVGLVLSEDARTSLKPENCRDPFLRHPESNSLISDTSLGISLVPLGPTCRYVERDSGRVFVIDPPGEMSALILGSWLGGTIAFTIGFRRRPRPRGVPRSG